METSALYQSLNLDKFQNEKDSYSGWPDKHNSDKETDCEIMEKGKILKKGI